ncbi:MAG: PepSY-like domain-containing protein [Ginsengibacter sp.]
MKTNKNSSIHILIISYLLVFLVSCSKEKSVVNPGVNAAAINTSRAVAVGTSSTSNDSIYVVGTCAHGHQLDSISITGLPAMIIGYLAGNYTGYTFQKAYTDKDSSGNIAGYVVIIQFNGNPVGVKFDASGNFLNVLEQREGHDLAGEGWHKGGRFDDRDGKYKDTVSMTSLPAAIAAYFNTNYPQDTLIRAYKNRDSSYIVFSIDDGAFATMFAADGSLIRRTELQQPRGGIMAINQSALTAAVQSYLSSTYPNYVFKQAFSFSENGAMVGYVVCIDANGTKYAVQFDASGNFVQAITLI